MSVILPKSSNYYFIVFIIIGILSIFGVFFVRKILKKTADAYMVSRMNIVQSEMFFYKNKYNDFKHACIHGSVSALSLEAIDELNSGLSCTVAHDYQSLSLYTTLYSKKIYCVDSSNFQGYILSQPKSLGSCSKT